MTKERLLEWRTMFLNEYRTSAIRDLQEGAKEKVEICDLALKGLEAQPEERDSVIEECAKVVEQGLYEADEAFLEKRGDEERIPYEVGQATIKAMAKAIRHLKQTPP